MRNIIYRNESEMAPTKNFDLVERFSVAFNDDNKLNALCNDIAIG